MNAILAIPTEFRLFVLFLVGAFAGGIVNLAVYRLAWTPRAISPWSRPHPAAPPRRWDDRLPIFGWLGLKRESSFHGPGFWVRPLLVELLLAIGLPALYWWEVEGLRLIAPGVAPPDPATLHVIFVSHTTLMLVMLVGSLIDLDERIIPDAITLPGTMLGLIFAAGYPWSLLPVAPPAAVGPAGLGPPALPTSDFLRLTSPFPWPAWLNGLHHAAPLAIGLACWWLWCVALMPRTWFARHGWRRALGLMLARLRRERVTHRIALMGALGSLAIAAVWFFGGPRWQALLSSLVGLAAGGGLVWVVRVIGTAVLQREAMGFGDVTLMAMIGSFLGWQACLMVFFLSPFAALLFGLATLILRRETEIPYGPFLCLGALVVIVRWAALWAWAEPIFALGAIVPLVLAVCMVLMVPLLLVLRFLRESLSSY